jgi:hypothetical protein
MKNLFLFLILIVPMGASAQCVRSSTTLCDDVAELPRLFTNWTNQAQVQQTMGYPDTCVYAGTSQPAGNDACGFYVTHVSVSGGFYFGAIQSALNGVTSTTCGTKGAILALPVGTYIQHAGVDSPEITLPQNGCGSGKTIILRSDVADAVLPPFNVAGQRTRPSLSGQMAIIEGPVNAAQVILTYLASTAGTQAAYYYLLGLEITTLSPTNGPDLIQIGNGESSSTLLPNHIVVDRCYLHGPDLSSDIHNAVDAEGNYVALINSTAIITNSDNEQHPYVTYSSLGPHLVDNNHLQGGAEQVFTGGAQPTFHDVPGLVTDVTITRNHMTRDTNYYPGDPHFNRVYQWCKNSVEFKEGDRILVEGNVIDYTWAGYTQNGLAFSIDPKSTPENPLESWVIVNDVTVRYNLIRHANGAIAMATTYPTFGNGYSTDGEKYFSVHDNVFTDIGNWGETASNNRLIQDFYPMAEILNSIDPAQPAPVDLHVFQNTILNSVANSETFFFPNNGEYYASGTVLANNVMGWGNGYGWFQSGGAQGCSALYGGDPNAVAAGNIITGVPTGSQGAYTSNCAAPPPQFYPMLITSATGGSIAASTTVYVRISYAVGTGETAATPEKSYVVWQPSTTFGPGDNGILLDSNNNTEMAYIKTTSGSAAPTWPTTLDSVTIDGPSGCHPPYGLGNQSSPLCQLWLLIGLGAAGTIQTGSGSTNTVTVQAPFSDNGAETGYYVYAGASSGSERYCGEGTIGSSFTISSLPCPGGRTILNTGNGMISALPTFACWPASYAALGFTDLAHGRYSLTASSCGHNAAVIKQNAPNGAAWTEFSSWTASALYSQFDTVSFVSGSTTYYAVALNGGTSGTAAPAWPTAQGATVNDNGITWEVFTGFDVGARTKLMDAKIQGVAQNLTAARSGAVKMSGGGVF